MTWITSLFSFFKEIPIFFKESWLELKQVSWLTFQQMSASTVLVILMSIIVSIYIYGVDKIIQLFFRFLV